jgi:hypothetical protein
VRRLDRAAALCVTGLLLLAAGCTSDDEDPAASEGRNARQGTGPSAGDRPGPDAGERRRASPSPPLEPATCPPGGGNCRAASGLVLYVERVDPDGDGDAHFVLASRQSITAPGISVIDVRRTLRPSPLPGPGDRMSAAGPVYRGSYGQRQIEAVELRVARRR